MNKRFLKVFFVLGIPLLAISILMVGLGKSKANSLPRNNGQTAFTGTISTTLDAPVLSPTNTGVCTSGWFSYTNGKGETTYLALNYTLTDTQALVNSGVWQPNLPKAGVYRVDVLLPQHPAIEWNCPPDQKLTVDGDTRTARYMVHSRLGEKMVILDQSISNDWQPLGEFLFDAGSDGFVQLNNLTSEESMTRTVSFSAMRFTWLRPVTVNLPLITKNSGFTLELQNLWTSDPNDNIKYAFLPGEDVVYHVTGSNPMGRAVTARVQWTRESATCGNTTVFSGTVDFKPGDWSISQSATLPDCIGLYTQTIKVTSFAKVLTQQSQFVTNRSSQILLSDRPAFDRCYAPTVEQMQAWKNKSPYDDFNLYIGGISFGCDDQPLDPVWVHQVSQQGWSFILTWVGPQAPCSKFLHKMSSIKTVAYVEGRFEAEDAVAAANRLGLMGDKIIYYDLESYSGATTSCRDTVKEFIRGWVERLHELGYKAGFYGSPCTSYIRDWATVVPPPDDVWIAYWTEDAYTETVNMLNVPCLDTDPDPNNIFWDNHQRIRQYTGGHRETYGGVSLVIDSNIADGEITTMQDISPSNSPNSGGVVMSQVTPQIQDVQLLPDGQGWALVGGRLLWSVDSGLEWQDRTPKAFANGYVLGGYFLDSNRGWFAVRDLDANQIRILRTQDGGKSWQEEIFGAASQDLSLQVAGGSFDFVDAQTGWLAFKLQSSSSFSLGELYGTSDGGVTWKHLDLPVGEAVHFIDARRGWVAGGVSGSQLYRTEDGGQTWQLQNGFDLSGKIPGQTFVSPPVFENEQDGSLVVTYGSAGDTQAAIYVTHDSGDSWQLSDNLKISSDFQPGSALPVSQAGSAGILLAAPDQGKLVGFSGAAKSVEQVQAPSLPQGVVKLSFVNSDFGWAQVQNGACDSLSDDQGKSCQLNSYLLMTQDGGRTWKNVTPR